MQLNQARKILDSLNVNKKINRDLVIDSMFLKRILLEVLLSRNFNEARKTPKISENTPEVWSLV